MIRSWRYRPALNGLMESVTIPRSGSAAFMALARADDRLREIPGVFSQGETLQELEGNIRDAYKLVVEEEMETLPRHDKTRTREISAGVLTLVRSC